MKLKNIFMLLAAMTAAMLTGCKEKSPFETQRSNDDPRILTPFNESGTGTFTYDLENPDTHFLDSCRVTPSSFTTVQWFVDKILMHTGLKMDQVFLAGNYQLLIKATTTEGKETSRFGTINVMPYAEDPYSADPEEGRHFVPGKEAQLDGDHLDLATQVLITSDIFAKDMTGAVAPTESDEHLLKFMVPQLADGRYFVRLIDAAGKVYGANHVDIHNGPVALAGYKEFTMEKPCTITGLNLQNVTAVTVGGQEGTLIEVTETSVSFVAPKLEAEGPDIISMKAGDVDVQFRIADGEYTTTYVANVLAKKLIIVADGPINVGCNGDPEWTARVIDNGFDWSTISAGMVMYIVAHRDGNTTDYNNFKVMTNDWAWAAPSDGNFEFGEGINEKTFTYTVTDDMISALIAKGGLCAAGHGTIIDRIYFEAPDETELLKGNFVIDWDAAICNVTPDMMKDVPVGSTILIYYDVPDAEYHQYRICTTWWNNVPGGAQTDIVAGTTPNPLELTYDASFKALSDEQGGWSCVGFGYTVTKITYK